MGVLHQVLSKGPTVWQAKAAASVAAIGPSVKRAIGHHRHRQTHGLELGYETVAPGFEGCTSVFIDAQALGFKASQGGVL
jgi:hypothetical protein